MTPPESLHPQLGRNPFQSLRFRIVAAFIASILAMFGAQAFLFVQQNHVTTSLTLMTDGYLPLTKVTAKLERDRLRIDRDIARLARDEQRPDTGQRSVAEIYTTTFRTNLREGQQHVARATELTSTTSERAQLEKLRIHLERIDEAAKTWEELAVPFVESVRSGRPDDNLLVRLRTTGARLSDEIGALQRTVDDRVTGLTVSTGRAQVRATAIAVVLSLLAASFSILLIGIVLFALRPIRRLTEQVQRLAEGDYSGRVDVRGGGEIAVLAAEFDNMIRAVEERDRTLVERAEELNRLSRYLASVLDSLSDALLVVEEDLVTLANPAATDTWSSHVGAAPPGDLAALTLGRHEVERVGRKRYEVRVERFGEQGRIIVAADITQQRDNAERLARSERLALIGQMLAQITHEVRNPLNAMSLNAELLGDELIAMDPDRTTEAWEQLAMISSEIDRLTAVTAHYLQLARRPPAQLVPTNLFALFTEIARLLEADLASHGAKLHVEATDTTAVPVDGNQIRQALLNVVRNAVEAGATSITLDMTRQDGEARISLHDNGPGMTDEEIARATDPFFSTKASGTGLGLAITRQILEDHHGGLEMTSPRAGGTIVQLTIPDAHELQ